MHKWQHIYFFGQSLSLLLICTHVTVNQLNIFESFFPIIFIWEERKEKNLLQSPIPIKSISIKDLSRGQMPKNEFGNLKGRERRKKVFPH